MGRQPGGVPVGSRQGLRRMFGRLLGKKDARTTWGTRTWLIAQNRRIKGRAKEGRFMESRRLGVTGPEVSVVGLGGNNFGMRLDERETRQVVHAALDAGITHFDTAEIYGGGRSEVFLGKALGARRSDVVVATKFAARSEEPYRPGLLRRRIFEGCDISLRRLGTDHIDLYYQHFPDSEAPIEETLQALSDLVALGKVRHVACSNFGAEQLDEAWRVSAERGTAKFVACQIHWNLLVRDVEKEIVPALRRHRMGIVPYFPLESGLLTGKYRQGQEFPAGSRLAGGSRSAILATEENFTYLGELIEFAASRGHSLLELAFAWLAAQEGLASIIAGATTPEQVLTNVKAGNAWRLSASDLTDIPQMK
jgi:aryl-alcohol dehydrogenase-like predicted oxidoreductase